MFGNMEVQGVHQYGKNRIYKNDANFLGNGRG